MLTAELSFRHYVPSGWFAFEHADLTFYGDIKITDSLNKLVFLIKHWKEKIFEKDMEKLKKLRTKTNHEIKDLEDTIDEIEEKHLLILFSKKSRNKLKELKQQLSDLKAKSSLINKKIEKIEKITQYSTITLVRKFKDLLTKLNFTCKVINTDDSNRTIEKYESTLSKEDFLNKLSIIEIKTKKEMEMEIKFERLLNKKDDNLEF